MIDTIEFMLDQNQARIADAYLRNLARIICTLGARGAGKSALIRAIVFMACISSRKQVLYASQSNGNSLDQFDKLIRNETAQEYLYQGTDQEPYTTKPVPIIRWANGSSTLFWSMESPQSKRGLHPHLIICDECQSISRTSFSRILYPMRTRIGGHARMLCFGSTPETDATWFWEMYQKGLTIPNDGGVMSFTMDTATSLAFKGLAGQQLLAEAKANMSEADFDSEFGLKPGGRGEPYFEHGAIDGCVEAYDARDVDQTNGTIMAYDPALGTQDPSAYLVSDLKGNVILSHSIPKDISDTETVAEVVSMAKQYRSLLVVESNGTASVTYLGALKHLTPYGVRAIPLRAAGTKAADSKNVLCKQLAWMMEQKQVRFNPELTGNLVKQLKSLRDYKTTTGQLQIRAPGKDHDDEAMCMVIAAEALAKGWSPYLGTDNQGANPLMGLL